MSPHLLRSIRAGRFLLALVLLAQLPPTSAAFSNGQAASLVLGQPDFTTSPQSTTASGVHTPHDVAIDGAGRLWVADTFNHRVLRFDNAASKANGAPADGVLGQTDFSSAVAATTASGMNFPFSLAIDGAGRLWVADTDNSRVLRFDNAASKPNGAPADGVLGQIDFNNAVAATTASGMNYPRGIAIDSAGRLWVAEYNNSRVLRFDGAASKPNGAPADGVLGQPDFTSSDAGTSASKLFFPRGIAVDAAGRLWVADTLNNRVLRFDGAASKPNGAPADGVLGQPDFVSRDAATGSGLNAPFGVEVDSAGRVWVADHSNNRVLRFNGAVADIVLGQPDFTSGNPATTATGMLFPRATAVDSTSLWVADGPRVLRFERAAAPTVTWANPTPISYGTALGAAQLNASASVPGSFSYSPPAGTVLSAGSGQALSVIFTPADLDNYTIATKTVTIDVLTNSVRLYLPPIRR